MSRSDAHCRRARRTARRAHKRCSKQCENAASGSMPRSPDRPETARLRSGAQARRRCSSSAPSEPGRAREHEAARLAQPTPLAWAPTIAAPNRRVRRRWPLALGSSQHVAAQRSRLKREARESIRTRLSDAQPIDAADARSMLRSKRSVGPQARRSDKAFALVDDEKSVAEYRAEAAAAVQRLPQDTRFVFTVAARRAARAERRRAICSTRSRSTRRSRRSRCMMPAVCEGHRRRRRVDRVRRAGPRDSRRQGTLILRGRWRRSRCRGVLRRHGARRTSTNDGAKLYRIGDDGWLDFLDDHTAIVTLNTKLEAEAPTQADEKRAGAGHARQSRCSRRCPPTRTIAIVADGNAERRLVDAVAAAAARHLRLDSRRARRASSLDLAADPHKSAGRKRRDHAGSSPQLDELFANTSAGHSRQARGRSRQDTVVHIRGNMTALMLGIVTAAIPL